MSAALPYIGLGLGVAGTVTQYQAEKRAGEEEQRGRELQAQLVERAGTEEETITREKLKSLLSTQRALYAKAGVDISSGSPLMVLANEAGKAEREALMVRREAKEKAKFERFAGSQAKETGRRKAGRTLLTGLGKAGTQAYTIYKNA